MNVAIIPARGGSKRIPRKNIRDFAGKPMIAYAIDIARKSDLFDRILVSTDDDEIAKIAGCLGAEVPFRRPNSLADDLTPTVPVIAHAIETCRELGWTIDRVCCIYPAVPFMQASDLEAALAMLQQNDNVDYVFPVTAFPSAIQRALRQLPDGRLQPISAQNTQIRTQDLEVAYYDAGQFYWGRANSWLAGKILHENGTGLVIPNWRVIDIDTDEDWTRAELVHGAISAGRDDRC